MAYVLKFSETGPGAGHTVYDPKLLVICLLRLYSPVWGNIGQRVAHGSMPVFNEVKV